MSLSRRSFLALAPVLPIVCSAGGVCAQLAKAPKRSRLSVNFRSSEMRLVTVQLPSTFMVSLPFETGAEAVRIGVANITEEPVRIAGICCSEVVNGLPVTPPGWAYFGFSRSGSDEVTQPLTSPQPIVVPGNTVGRNRPQRVPAIVWSDWMAYRTTAPGRPQMQFRALVPAQVLPMAYPLGPGDVGQFAPTHPVHTITEFVAEGDHVRPLNGKCPARGRHRILQCSWSNIARRRQVFRS